LECILSHIHKKYILLVKTLCIIIMQMCSKRRKSSTDQNSTRICFLFTLYSSFILHFILVIIYYVGISIDSKFKKSNLHFESHYYNYKKTKTNKHQDKLISFETNKQIERPKKIINTKNKLHKTFSTLWIFWRSSSWIWC